MGFNKDKGEVRTRISPKGVSGKWKRGINATKDKKVKRSYKNKQSKNKRRYKSTSSSSSTENSSTSPKRCKSRRKKRKHRKRSSSLSYSSSPSYSLESPETRNIGEVARDKKYRIEAGWPIPSNILGRSVQTQSPH